MTAPLSIDVVGALVPTAVVVAALGGVYVVNVRTRARSRRGHADAATTGQGSWDGMLDEADLERFIPSLAVGALKATILFDGGVPVRLEVSPNGLRLVCRSKWLRAAAAHAWVAPWTDVVSAEGRSVGFKQMGGKLSTIRRTDVAVLVSGSSAHAFLDSWGLIPDADEPPPSAEDLVEDAEWLRQVREELGPTWVPGTALLRIRTSAPDGLVELVNRWARGSAPPSG